MKDQSKKTMSELGKIILTHFTPDQVKSGYRVDPADEAEVGRQALTFGDINRDGTLN